MKGKITAIALVILCIQCLTSSLIARVEAETSSPLQYSGNWCLDFDGENDYVTCGSSSLFRLSVLTIEAWVRPKYMITEGSNSEYGHTHGFIISRRSSVFLTSGFGFTFDYANGYLVFAFCSGSYSFSHHTDRSVWYNTSCYHIAVTYNRTQPSDNLKFYVNGTLDSGHSRTNVITYADDPLWIGRKDNHAFGGTIDEVRVWNVSRSQQQIESTMPRILNETETESPNLVGYWRFDEGSGLISQDSSIYDNDAVLVNSPADPQWTQGCCPIIPEFLPIVTPPLFMAATLLGAAIYRRKRFT